METNVINSALNKEEALKYLPADDKLQRDLMELFTVHLENARIVTTEYGYSYPVLDLVYNEYILEQNGNISIREIRRYLMPFRDHHLQICASEYGEWDLGSSIPLNFQYIEDNILATIAAEVIYEFARTNIRTAPYALSRYFDPRYIDNNKMPDQFEFGKFIKLIKNPINEEKIS